MNHLWQSTWFALAAALLTLAFRKNRAQVRYWLWLAASIKFLIPFSILMSLGSGNGLTRMSQYKVTLDLYGVTMEDLARKLNMSGRPVVDRTGIEGRFDVTLTFSPEEGTVRLPPGVELPSLPDGELPPPSIFTALQQYGLKLEPIKGPREFLVIDHIEKPTEN